MGGGAAVITPAGCLLVRPGRFQRNVNQTNLITANVVTFAHVQPQLTLKVFSALPTGVTKLQTGIEQLGQTMQQGLQNFYQARSKGQKSVVGVFTTDLSTVSTTEVKTTLTDATASFVVLPIAADSDIRTFVERAQPGSRYQKGSGYYELTKPELIQEYKEVAIVEKATGKIYVGDDARTLLGLPIAARIKVRPGDHAGFSVYVQSTSVNRRLEAGTTLLYRK